MKYGLLLSFQAPAQFGTTPTQVYGESLEQAELAESLGFDSVWTTEHHFLDDGYLPSPLIAASALAARTKRLRVGLGILLLPLYGHPLRLAEDAAVVDVLSNGRLLLGFGMGYRDYEFAGFGLDMRQRRSMFDEGLELLRRGWEETEVSFQGRHWQAAAATVTPRPVQPKLPLWLGATSLPAIERAARLGAAFIAGPASHRRQVARQIASYREQLAAHGHDPAAVEVGLMRECWVADDEQAAWDEVRDNVLYTYRVTYGPDHVEHRDVAPDGSRRQVTDPNDSYFESERFRADRFVLGGPDFVVSELGGYRDELQPDSLVLRFQFPGMPHDAVCRAMERFAREVLPRL